MLMAILSLSLGVLNLLPIPVLDGGQIAVLLVESVARRDLSIRVRQALMVAGAAFMLVVFALVISSTSSRSGFWDSASRRGPRERGAAPGACREARGTAARLPAGQPPGRKGRAAAKARAAKRMPSTRSSTPPWPGMRRPASFRPEARFQ